MMAARCVQHIRRHSMHRHRTSMHGIMQDQCQTCAKSFSEMSRIARRVSLLRPSGSWLRRGPSTSGE